MVTKIFNPNNISDNEINKFVTRVKILLLNSQNQILLCHSDDGYSFVGGHLEDGESILECFKRELQEETGIILEESDYVPFYKLVQFSDNYFNSKLKCKSTIIYFAVKTDKSIDKEKMSLDDREKNSNFSLVYVDKNNFERLLKSDLSYIQKNHLYNEMVDAMQIYNEQFSIFPPKINKKGGI